MRGNPIETVRLKRVASTDGGLSVPSCGAIPSKRREIDGTYIHGVDLSVPSCGAIPSKRLLSGTMKCTTWSFSPLMRGNPIETCTAGMCGVVASCNFQSPHAGQSHRNMMKSMCQCQNCQIFQSPHAGQSHRNSAVSRVPLSCKATFSPLMRGNPIETARRTRENKPYQDFQSPHAGQSHRNRPIDKAHSSVDT